MVAEELDIGQQTLSDIIKSTENSISGKIGKEWNLDSKDKNHDSLKPAISKVQCSMSCNGHCNLKYPNTPPTPHAGAMLNEL